MMAPFDHHLKIAPRLAGAMIFHILHPTTISEGHQVPLDFHITIILSLKATFPLPKEEIFVPSLDLLQMIPPDHFFHQLGNLKISEIIINTKYKATIAPLV